MPFKVLLDRLCDCINVNSKLPAGNWPGEVEINKMALVWIRWLREQLQRQEQESAVPTQLDQLLDDISRRQNDLARKTDTLFDGMHTDRELRYI
jgi:hypothetical protein